MLQPCDPESPAFQYGIIQTNGKEHILTPLDLLVKRRVDLSLNPRTTHGVLGQNEQELVRPVIGMEDLRTEINLSLQTNT